MVTREEFLNAVEVIKQYKAELAERYKNDRAEVNKAISHIPKTPPSLDGITKDTLIKDVDLSGRLRNIFRRNYRNVSELKVSDLAELTEREFERLPGAGKGTLRELKAVCASAGVSLKQP